MVALALPGASASSGLLVGDAHGVAAAPLGCLLVGPLAADVLMCGMIRNGCSPWGALA